MRYHGHIRDLLYEYLRGELREHDRDAVEEHLTSCRRCREACEDLRAVLDVVPRPVRDPAEECPPELWENLMSSVEKELRSVSPKRASRLRSLGEEIAALPLFQPKMALALGALLVVLAAGIVSWELTRSSSPEREMAEAPPAARPKAETTSSPAMDARVHTYLRRSKVLLVGLANMKTDQASSMDLSTEQRTSCDLVDEARYLAQQPLDDRSATLINDLQKIHIELSNIDGRGGVPDIELIRQGIERENLLFKVRVAETLYERANVMRTHYER